MKIIVDFKILYFISNTYVFYNLSSLNLIPFLKALNWNVIRVLKRDKWYI